MAMAKIEKIKTGIGGFDLISEGGFPANRTTLISGSAGSGKTVFAIQFLIEPIRQHQEGGVFVTFEESPEDIRKNMASFGWDIRKKEEEGLWAFVDAAIDSEMDLVAGDYDLSALLARIEYAVKKVNAKRVALDSLGAIFSQFGNNNIVRRELFRIASALKEMNVTSIMTAERIDEYGLITRYGVEEFVTDNVIILRNVLEGEKRRRTIEILKFRGASHQAGEYPLAIRENEGLVIIPLSSIELIQKSSDVRVTSGNEELDAMCGGGFFRDSITLVSGATGTGKTLTVTQFIAGGVRNGERCMLLAFEESRDQLFRNAKGWGVDFEAMEKEGHLKVICSYPERAGLEDHLIDIRTAIEEYNPDRLAIDSLTALERISTLRGFREFVIALTSHVKQKGIAGLFTTTTANLIGSPSITESHISTITDAIILLRYLETSGRMRRGLTVLKMRGSMHDKSIREIRIDQDGMHIGDQIDNIEGILSGAPHYTSRLPGGPALHDQNTS